MKPATFRAALRAAQALTGVGVGVGIGAFAGCSSPAATTAPVTTIPVAPATATTDVGAPLPPQAPASAVAASGERADRCLAIIEQTFGPVDNYVGRQKDADPELVRCCDAALTSPDPGFAAIFERHHWGCCSVTTVHPEPASVCIPWGPPVPPPMSWRARRRGQIVAKAASGMSSGLLSSSARSCALCSTPGRTFRA